MVRSPIPSSIKSQRDSDWRALLLPPHLRTAFYALLPAVLLSLILLLQALLARTHQLSLGQSHGFDIVSTLDEPQTRRVAIQVIGTSGSRQIEESRGTQFLELQALNLPTSGRLLQLARKVARDPSGQGDEPEAVRVQVWRTSYDSGTLEPRLELIREAVLDLSTSPESR